MPISKRILISYEEYQRLIAIEKRYNHVMQKPPSAKADEDSASDLVGAGNSTQMPVIPMPGMRQDIPNSFPAEIDTNVLPPKPNPIVHTMVLPDNEDRIKQEAKRDKSLAPSLPLNDALGVSDPSLPDGRAPEKQFLASKRQRNEDDSTSLGHPPTKAEVSSSGKWYYCGPSNFSSDDDEELEDW